MSKNRDLLLVMRVIGIVVIIISLLGSISAIVTVSGRVSAQHFLGSYSISPTGSVWWYVERVLLVTTGLVIGVGLYLKRNWGRILFLCISPMYLIYQYLVCSSNGINMIYLLQNLIITVALVCYFMSRPVRNLLKE